jgi:polysaccharide biosynthesis transport protein
MPPSAEAFVNESTGPSIGFWGSQWRWKWLILFLGLVGSGIGYLLYSQTPPSYRSESQLKVESSGSLLIRANGSEVEQARQQWTIDEAAVIRGDAVVERAIRDGRLEGLRTFRGKVEPKALAPFLGDNVQVTTGSMTDHSNVLRVSFIGPEPNDASAVVNAICEAYRNVSHESRNAVVSGFVGQVQQLQKKANDDLQVAQRELEQFMQSSNLVIRDGQQTSSHRETVDLLQGKKRVLAARRAQLISLLDTANAAEKRGDAPKARLLMLQRALNQAAQEDLAAKSLPNAAENTRVQQLLDSEYYPLKAALDKLRLQYGDNHPTILSKEKELAALKEKMGQVDLEAFNRQEELAQSQRELEAELQGKAEGSAEELLASIRQELESNRRELELLDVQYADAKALAQAETQAEVRAARLQGDVKRFTEAYNMLVQTLKQVDLSTVQSGNTVTIYERADVGSRIAPSLSSYLMCSGLIGLLIGSALGYVLELGSRTFRSPDEISQALGIPVLAHIPVAKRSQPIGQLAGRVDDSLVTATARLGPPSEAYRGLRTSLYFNALGKNGTKVVQVTSAEPSEGKSTIAANLAITMAQSGKSVLLLDADFRRPRQHELFQIKPSDNGLASVVKRLGHSGDELSWSTIAEAIVETSVENLSLMACGQTPKDPAELLTGRGFESLLDQVREKFDCVVVDTPPVLAVSDPLAVAARADGVLFVIRIRRNVRKVVSEAIQALDGVNARLIGVVVNQLGSRDAAGYDYGPGQSYGYYADRYGVRDDGVEDALDPPSEPSVLQP